MDAYFNELSISEISIFCYETASTTFDEQIQRLINIYPILKASGINICRISEECLSSIISKAQEENKLQTDICGLIYSFFQTPFENNSINDRDDEYLLHVWTHGQDECYGLALAFIMDSITVSIGIGTWNLAYVDILKDQEKISVRNVFSIDHLSVHGEWLDSLKNVELIECNLSFGEKPIYIRHDHGENILREFAEKIVRNVYVCGVINSLPYNSHFRKFIHRIKQDGIIEIVLPWTDRGLGIVVKTTGRTIRETTAIAEVLKKEYGKY